MSNQLTIGERPNNKDIDYRVNWFGTKSKYFKALAWKVFF